MKKRLIKSLLCLSLSAMMVFGEIGTVFAADNASMEADSSTQVVEETETASEDAVIDDGTISGEEKQAPEDEVVSESNVTDEQTANGETEDILDDEDIIKTEETEVSEEKKETLDEITDEQTEEKLTEDEDIDEEKAAVVAEVTDLTASIDSGYVYVDFTLTGQMAEVYINDVLVPRTYYADSYRESDAYAEAWTVSDSVWVGYYAGSYKIKVVPYDYSDTAGTSKSVTESIAAGKVSFDTSYATIESSQGYYKPAIYISWNLTGSANVDIFEIYRSTSKDGTFKKIDSVWGSGYTDSNNILPNTTYYYKVKVIYNTSDYIKTAKTVTSSVFSGSKVTWSSYNMYLYVTLNAKGLPTLSWSDYNDFTSGYEVYRATSRSGKYTKVATVTGKSYTDSSITKSKTYYYKVRPYYYSSTNDKKYYGSYSDIRGVKVILGSFSDVTATLVNYTTAKLTWSKVVGADGYDIYMRTSMAGDAYTKIASVTGTSYTKKGLTKGDYYYFKIQAYKKNSSGVKTYFCDGSTGLGMVLQAPEVSYTTKRSYSDGKLKLTYKLKWDKVYNATGYKIYVDGKLKKTTTATSYNYIVTLSESNRSYGEYIRVESYKGSDTASDGVWIEHTLANTSSVTVTKKGTSQATITWKAVTGATEYTVYRISPTGNTTYVTVTSKTSCVDSDLAPGVKYIYRIQPTNDDLNISGTAYSGIEYTGAKYEKTFTLSLSAPSGVKATSTKENKTSKATITWSRNTLASSYIIYRSTSKDGTYTKVGTVSKGTTTTYTDKSGLKSGTTYYYKVVAATKTPAGMTVTSAKSSAASVKAK